MPHSHHSHSGEFCESHAIDTLEEVVMAAIRQKMQVFALSEHIPRLYIEDLYPGEIKSTETLQKLSDIFDKFYAEARRLQAKYADTITILVGFEIDWMRPDSGKDINKLLERHQWDMFVGSVHHVHGIAIDYSPTFYSRALEQSKIKAGESELPADPEEMLFADYFDAQLDMLQALQPPVVGHIDVIRLLSHDPNISMDKYPQVWQKILRNLQYIQEYGGVIEVNSAAIRKGLKEPYPSREILERVIEIGGKIALSDDSHGTKQIGWGYPQMLNYLHSCGVETVTYFEPSKTTRDPRFPGIGTGETSLEELRKQPFWLGIT